jgi:hypothetical protein
MNKPLLIVILVALQAIDEGGSFVINCTFRMTSRSIVGSVYECYTHSLPPTSANHTITRVTGQHIDWKVNADVTSVIFDGNRTLSFFPRGIINFFPNIIVHIVDYGGFETLRGDEYNDMPRLEYLAIWYSNLKTIPSSLLEAQTNLKVISFQSNKLERVGHDLFTPLNITILQRAYFSSNPCININASNTTQIMALIEYLHMLCPYDEEALATTTTTLTTEVTTPMTTEVTTTTTGATTTEADTCIEGSVDEMVCRIDEDVSEISQKLQAANERVAELENELKDAKRKINDLQEEVKDERTATNNRLEWLESEILRLTTNPCACI